MVGIRVGEPICFVYAPRWYCTTKSSSLICSRYCMCFKSECLSGSAMLFCTLAMSSVMSLSTSHSAKRKAAGRTPNVQQRLLLISSARTPQSTARSNITPAHLDFSFANLIEIDWWLRPYLHLGALARLGRSFEIPTRQRAHCPRHSFFRATHILALLIAPSDRL